MVDVQANAVALSRDSAFVAEWRLHQRLVFVSRAPLLQALIGLFELPEDDSIPDDEHFIDIEDTPGYQTAFSQLAFAGKKEHDPIGEAVGNPKILLAQSLHKLSTACPGRVRQANPNPNPNLNRKDRLVYLNSVKWLFSCWSSSTAESLSLSLAGSFHAEH